jgi:hypothetical protein
MKGTCFSDMVAIQERVTAVLRLIPKEPFADSFQKLYERYDTNLLLVHFLVLVVTLL